MGRRWLTTPEPGCYDLKPEARLATRKNVEPDFHAGYVRSHLMGTRASFAALDWGRSPSAFVVRNVEQNASEKTRILRLTPTGRDYRINAGAMFQTTSWAYVHSIRIAKSELRVDAGAVMSAFYLNHAAWFKRYVEGTNQFHVVEERASTPEGDLSTTDGEQAKVVLRFLGLDGPHGIMGKPNAERMTINRASGAGHYRIVWLREESRLVVKRQKFTPFRILTYLHFRHGYGTPYLRADLWAFVVDLLVIAIWLWGVTGVWLWARKRPGRWWGVIAIAGGLLLFLCLAVILSL